MSTDGSFFRIIIPILMEFLHRNIEGNSNVGCLPTQYVELGRQGYITCIFPTQLSEVYWYDDASGRSNVPPIAIYRIDAEEKEGPGIGSGEYDILSNGTLVITNVTVRYEKQYRVLACTQSCRPLSTISVKVVVYPRALSPRVPSCDLKSPCTVRITKTGHPICQIDSARPPVDLEWLGQLRGEGIHVEGQVSFNELNSDGITYKSIAALNETINTERLLATYICKPRWISDGLIKEKNILLDYSEEIDPLNPSSGETVYYEINRRSELRCKISNFSAMIWRKVTSSENVKTIGLLFKDVIHTNEEFSDNVRLSSDGCLIFTSLQLQHEGTYACIYDDGRDVKGINTRYVQVLVPPSPPYIKIQECQKDDPCIFRGNKSGSLTCVIHGVRPEVALTWVGTNDELVTLHNVRTVIQKRRQLTDVSVSVHYELTNYIVCGTSIELKCQVGHPISQIIQPYATAVIYADKCTDRDDDDDDDGNEIRSISTSATVVIVVAAVCTLFIGSALIYYLMKCFKRNDYTKDKNSVDCVVENTTLVLKPPNGHDMQTSECVENEKHVQSEKKKDENEIPLTKCSGNGMHNESIEPTVLYSKKLLHG